MKALVVALAIGLLLAFAWARAQRPLVAATPPVPGRATLGAHALVGQEDDRAPAVARTRPMATRPAGSSFVAIVAGYAENDAAPIDNLGNAWRAHGDPVVYAGYEGRFDVRAYLALDGRGGERHVVEVAKPGHPEGELTLPVVEIRDGARLVDAAQVYAPPGTRLESGVVETDGPALLVAFWFGDGRGLRHRAEPGDGFRVIERFTDLPPNSAVQCVVAVREVDRAGRWSVAWDTEPAQGAPLWLFAFASPKSAS